jgi:3-oxoacyl-[acyl-carrier protein] reductase
MDFMLQGKVAMVAASSRGLGFGVARELASEGVKVFIASRDLDAAKKAALKLREETNAPVLASSMDTKDPASIADWTSRTVSEFGGVDLLVTNPGGPPAGSFELNLLSTIRMIRSVLPSMRQRGGGSIPAITSFTVKEPSEQLIL